MTVNDENFPIEISIEVKWGDMDALQHVNNTIFFKYFETVRIAHFDHFELMNALSENGMYPILAATSCSFLKPLTYPDTVRCASRIARIGRTSFVQDYRIYDGVGDLSATGEGVVVIMDSVTHIKKPIPDFVLEKFYTLQAELRK